jgi:hypothetical protein
VHASLAACIFGFQNCWSPFLAWANSWVSDLGTWYDILAKCDVSKNGKYIITVGIVKRHKV